MALISVTFLAAVTHKNFVGCFGCVAEFGNKSQRFENRRHASARKSPALGFSSPLPAAHGRSAARRRDRTSRSRSSVHGSPSTIAIVFCPCSRRRRAQMRAARRTAQMAMALRRTVAARTVQVRTAQARTAPSRAARQTVIPNGRLLIAQMRKVLT